MIPVEQLAEKIVRAIFDRAEDDGALHKDSAIDVTRRVLLTNYEPEQTFRGHPFPPPPAQAGDLPQLDG